MYIESEVLNMNNVKEKEYLTFEDFMNFISTMACSQGFYGRLKRDIQELDCDELEKLKKVIENKKFTDTLDIVFWLEG
jgi:predicted Ser/Thr protein kinase